MDFYTFIVWIVALCCARDVCVAFCEALANGPPVDAEIDDEDKMDLEQ